MMWQFGELGYDYSINDCGNGTISDDCRLSRKPIRWDYREVDARAALYDHILDLTHLRKNYPATFQSEEASINVDAAVKNIVLPGTELSAVAVGNFGINTQNTSVAFPSDGTWYDYFSERTIDVTGGSFSFNLAPGQQHLWLTEEVDRPSLTGGLTSTDDFLVGQILRAYPNPVRPGQSLRLDLGEETLSSGHLRIIDSRGVVSWQMRLPENTGGLPVLELQAPELASGLYVVEIVSRTEGKVLISKIMIE